MDERGEPQIDSGQSAGCAPPLPSPPSAHFLLFWRPIATWLTGVRFASLQEAVTALQHLNEENAALRAQLHTAHMPSNAASFASPARPAAGSFGGGAGHAVEEEDDGPGSEASLLRLLGDTLSEQRVYLERRSANMHEYRSALSHIGTEDGGLVAQLNTVTSMREEHIRR